MLEFATIAISAKFMNIPVLALAPVALLGFRWWVIYRFYDGRRGLSPAGQGLDRAGERFRADPEGDRNNGRLRRPDAPGPPFGPSRERARNEREGHPLDGGGGTSGPARNPFRAHRTTPSQRPSVLSPSTPSPSLPAASNRLARLNGAPVRDDAPRQTTQYSQRT
jgi:hypothetical protein